MNIHIGPLARQKFRELHLARLGRLRVLFWLLLLSGPLVLFALHKTSLIKPLNLGQVGEGVVAMVKTDGSFGSAFNVGPTQWITALHVVENMDLGSLVELEDKFDKKAKSLSAIVKYQSTNNELDFAFLESDETSVDNQVFFGLGDFNNVAISDEVIIIGYPAGYYSRAKSQVINLDIENNSELFLMAGNAWPGNSGGPIIHSKTGEVIGILIAGFEQEYKGMVVGLKIDQVKKKYLENLK